MTTLTIYDQNITILPTVTMFWKEKQLISIDPKVRNHEELYGYIKDFYDYCEYFDIRRSTYDKPTLPRDFNFNLSDIDRVYHIERYDERVTDWTLYKVTEKEKESNDDGSDNNDNNDNDDDDDDDDDDDVEDNNEDDKDYIHNKKEKHREEVLRNKTGYNLRNKRVYETSEPEPVTRKKKKISKNIIPIISCYIFAGRMRYKNDIVYFHLKAFCDKDKGFNDPSRSRGVINITRDVNIFFRSLAPPIDKRDLNIYRYNMYKITTSFINDDKVHLQRIDELVHNLAVKSFED